ncbi:MAG: 2-oxoacid:acceptor oxidoreductase family protein [Bacteroidota bacterium]
MKRTEIKIGGFGGQGVILSGYVLGRAAAIYDNKYATMIQAFGPEARGSACSAQVIVSSDPIDYPYIVSPSIMIVMSQEAYSRFSPELAKGGTLITEEELVVPHNLRKDLKHYSIPATRIAEELGKKLVLNIMMMGFMTAVTNLLDPDAMRKAVTASVPKGTEDLNLRAFERGYEYGVKVIGGLAAVGVSIPVRAESKTA